MSDQQSRASGGCLCGGVRFKVRGPLRDVILCHCGQCRRTHGHVAAYSSAALRDVVLDRDTSLKWYESSEKARRGFCADCGSSLFWEPVGDGRLAIAAGSLDVPTGLKTVRHVFAEARADYYEITDDLPRDDASHYRD